MLTRIGILSLLAGLFMGLFSGISQFMGGDNIWIDLTLSKVFGEDTAESVITFFDVVMIQESLDYLFYKMPLFGLLLLVGGIFLVIGMFIKQK